MYGSNCKGAEEEGVSILHGNRGVYHDDKQPTFKTLYEVIRDVSLLSRQRQCFHFSADHCFIWVTQIAVPGDEAEHSCALCTHIRHQGRFGLSCAIACVYLR